MTRWLLVCSGISLWVGATLLLAQLRWFRHVPLADRVRPYVVGSRLETAGGGAFSVESLRDVLVPIADTVGARISRVLGLGDDAASKLARVAPADDLPNFRLRQVTGAVTTALAALVVCSGVGAPPVLTVAATLVALGGVYLAIEQHLSSRNAAWQRRVTLELPIIIEQLGMLLSSGHSLSGSIARIGARGSGECARCFRQVTARMSQGVGEVEALREWAEFADVDAVHRLVAALSMNREASDLGLLIATEARTVRRQVHRELLEAIERRGQTVWIPVTVATLLPGVIFMAVPFVDAMSKLTGR